jgi:hypothetical protein
MRCIPPPPPPPNSPLWKSSAFLCSAAMPSPRNPPFPVDAGGTCWEHKQEHRNENKKDKNLKNKQKRHIIVQCQPIPKITYQILHRYMYILQAVQTSRGANKTNKTLDYSPAAACLCCQPSWIEPYLRRHRPVNKGNIYAS